MKYRARIRIKCYNSSFGLVYECFGSKTQAGAPSGGTWLTIELAVLVHCNNPSVVSVVSLREHWQLLFKSRVASRHLRKHCVRSSSPQWLSAYLTQLYLCLEAEGRGLLASYPLVRYQVLFWFVRSAMHACSFNKVLSIQGQSLTTS